MRKVWEMYGSSMGEVWGKYGTVCEKYKGSIGQYEETTEVA